MKRKIRILIFSWRDLKHPLAGGAEQVVHEHCKGWIKAGHSVTFFSSRFNGSKESENIDGVKIIRLGYQYLGVQIAGFFYYLKNKDDFDLIIDQFHGLPFFTPLYVKKPKIALIQETARKVWFLNPLPFPLNLIVGFIGYILEPFIFLFYRSTNFATGSQSTRMEVSKFFIPLNQIKIWPHGVIAYHPKKIVKEKIPTIVYLGILSKDKGIEDAIKCFSILDKQAKFQFWIIGKPETVQYLIKIKKLVESLNLKNKIKFWGFVSHIKKFELLARAHILINPSTREGWGLVNIEANRMKVPVISFNNAGLTDSVKHNFSGIICERNTPEDLSENILKVLRNKRLYEKLSRGAYEWSRNFNWVKSIKISLTHINNTMKI